VKQEQYNLSRHIRLLALLMRHRGGSRVLGETAYLYSIMDDLLPIVDDLRKDDNSRTIYSVPEEVTGLIRDEIFPNLQGALFDYFNHLIKLHERRNRADCLKIIQSKHGGWKSIFEIGTPIQYLKFIGRMVNSMSTSLIPVSFIPMALEHIRVEIHVKGKQILIILF